MDPIGFLAKKSFRRFNVILLHIPYMTYIHAYPMATEPLPRGDLVTIQVEER